MVATTNPRLTPPRPAPPRRAPQPAPTVVAVLGTPHHLVAVFGAEDKQDAIAMLRKQLPARGWKDKSVARAINAAAKLYRLCTPPKRAPKLKLKLKLKPAPAPAPGLVTPEPDLEGVGAARLVRQSDGLGDGLSDGLSDGLDFATMFQTPSTTPLANLLQSAVQPVPPQSPSLLSSHDTALFNNGFLPLAPLTEAELIAVEYSGFVEELRQLHPGLLYPPVHI